MVPTTHHHRRNAEVFGHGLDRIAFADLVAGGVTRVGHNISAERVLAGDNGNNQLTVLIEFLSVEIISFGDRLGTGAVSAGD